MKRFRALSLVLAVALVVSSLTPTSVSAVQTKNKVKLNKKKITLSVGQVKKVKVVPYKSNKKYETGNDSFVTKRSADGKFRAKVKCTSSNKKVARVVKSKVFVKKANIRVKGIAPGKATIKVKYKRRYLSTTLKFKVNVVPAVGPEETVAPATTAPVVSATPDAPTEVPTDAPTKAPTKVPTEKPTKAPTAVPTKEPTPIPPRDQVSLTFDANDIIVVNGGEGAKATVNADGSVSFNRADGFSGLMIPVPENYVINNGQSFHITMDYTSEGSTPRIYLVNNTVDSAISNIIPTGESPLKGMLTATSDGANYIFVKAAAYDALFTSLKINSIILSDDENIVTPTKKPTTTEEPATTEKPTTTATPAPTGELVKDVELSDADSRTIDGNATVAYEGDALNGTFPWGTGIIIKAPTDDVFHKVEVTYTSNGPLNVYLFDSTFTDGVGQFATGQHEVSPKISAASSDNTITWEYTADAVKAIKFVALDGTTNINIKSVKFIGPEVEAPATATPAPTEAPATEAPATATPAPTEAPATEAPATEAPTSTPAPYEKAGEIKLDEATVWDKLLNIITFGRYELPEPTVTITSDIPNAEISYYVVTDGETTALTEEQLDALSAESWTVYTGVVTLTSEKNVVYAKIVDPATTYVYYLCTDGITKVTATTAPTEKPADELVVEVNLPDEDASAVDGNATVQYNDETATLDGTFPWGTGIVIKAPTDNVFTRVEMTYTSTGPLNGYVFDENFTDGMGQFADGQHESTKVTTAITENTVTFEAVGDCIKAIKLVSLDGTTTINIKSVKFIGPAGQVIPTAAPTVEPTAVPTAEPTVAPTAVPTKDPATNLVTNGDFSNGKTGWSTNFNDNNLTVSEDGYGVVTGRWNDYSAVKYVINRRFDAGDVVEFEFDVKLAENYEENGNVSFAYWFASSDGTEGTKYRCYDADGNVVYGNADTWTTVKGTYTVPAYTESLTIFIGEGPGYNADRNGDFYVDNLYVSTENEEPPLATASPTPEPTAVPTVGPTRAPMDVAFDANGIVVVGGDEGAKATVNADGSVSYEREAGFSGFMIPLPAEYALNNGETIYVNIDYTSEGCDARSYLIIGTIDDSKSNILGPSVSPLNGAMTTTADGVNYIFVKASAWNTSFTALKINSISLSQAPITIPTATPSPEPEPTPVVVPPVSDTYEYDGDEYDVFRYSIDTTDIDMNEKMVAVTVYNDTRIEDFTFDLDMVNGYIEEYETIWDFADTLSKKTAGSITKYFGDGEASYTATGALTGTFHVKNGSLDKTASVVFERTDEYITATIKFPATTYVATVTSAEKNKSTVVKNGEYNYYLEHEKRADGYTATVLTPSKYLAVFDKTGDVYSYVASKDFVEKYNVSTEYIVEEY